MYYTIYYGTRPNGEDKIGCDENYPNRPIQQQLSNYYIMEEHADEMLASIRERELQTQHNLPVDRFPYHLRKVRGSKGGINSTNRPKWNTEEASLAGNNGIASRKENGQYQSKEWKEFSRQKSLKTKTCPHCGVTQRVMNYGRYHGDKCKLKA